MEARRILNHGFSLLAVLVFIWASSGYLVAQLKHRAVEAMFAERSTGVWTIYWVSGGFEWERFYVGMEYGLPMPAEEAYEGSLIFRAAFTKSKFGDRVVPYTSLRLSYSNVPKAPVFGTPSKAYYAMLHNGAKLMLWDGIHLTGEAGGYIQKFDVPAKQHFLEERLRIRPSLLVGLGYTLGLRPWKGLRQRQPAIPALDQVVPRHTVGLKASQANYFIFPPTIEYRMDYAYSLKPRWDVYGGVELGVSRWFFPTEAGRDSVKLLGGRVGARFFPLGRGRLSYYADGSIALGKRLNRYFYYLGPNTKNLQAELGGGLRLGLYKGLSADLAFFQRWFWVFPGNGMNRSFETGVVFGLSYGFGGQKR